MRLHLIITGALLCGGCYDSIDGLDPMVGPALSARCVNVDSDPGTDVSFATDIQPMLNGDVGPGCGCHLQNSSNPIGIEEVGLDLSTFSSLRAGGVNTRSNIVVVNEPCSSVLWQKISPGPPFGSRMPFDGPPFLEEADRRLIADWIAEGARDN